MTVQSDEATFKKLLINYSLESLENMQHMIKDEISSRKPTATDLIKIIPDFCSDQSLMDTVKDECEQLLPNSHMRKVSTQWLCPTLEPYVYPDVNPVHKAKDIKDFSGITKLLSFVNASELVDGPLDSCLILKYPSLSAALSLHADDEPIIDQTKSICPFTIGSSRTLEFFSTSKKSKKVLEVRMDNGSLVVMRPGTQETLKHCVRAEPSTSSESSGELSASVRYCLSFRSIAKQPQTPDPSPLCSSSASNISSTSVNNTEPPESKPKQMVYLVAGDSYAARLDAEKLGHNKCKVINIAKGGSRIVDVKNQIIDFFDKHGSDIVVKKLIISVGTNDIRYCRTGVGHLKGPLRKLCDTISNISPSTKVFFQSLMPLPLKHRNDFSTPQNILNMNYIIYNCCAFRRFHYIDAISDFLYPPRFGVPQLRNEYLFNTDDIHPNHKGIVILAKKYKFALHSMYFDPMIYQ